MRFGSRRRRGTEYVLIFFVLVGGWAALEGGWSPVPALLVGGAAATAYLWRTPGFDRGDLVRVAGLRAELPSMLRLWSVAAVVAVLLLAVFLPDRLFALPRHQPLLWAAIVVGYPLLSVYPQEIIFRAFLLRRYEPVFGTGVAATAASALAFGFAHIIFGSVVSVVLTVFGGALFAHRYRRTRSVLIVSVEHAAYGLLIFTVGLGDLFYQGGPPLR